MNNVTALMGLLVLGFPVTTTVVKTVLSWTLLADATMEFVATTLGLQVRLAPIGTCTYDCAP